MELVLAVVLIFMMRVADVTLGTLRIIQLVRGNRFGAGMLGFFESLIWVLAARQVLADLDEPAKIIGYAAGYAAGTMLGGTVERWLAMGTAIVRVIAPVDSPPAYQALQDAGFPTTILNGEGRDGPVRIVFSVVRRREVPPMLAVVKQVNPHAIVTVEETRLADLASTRRATALRK